jgi:hypothetical protein
MGVDPVAALLAFGSLTLSVAVITWLYVWSARGGRSRILTAAVLVLVFGPLVGLALLLVVEIDMQRRLSADVDGARPLHPTTFTTGRSCPLGRTRATIIRP